MDLLAALGSGDSGPDHLKCSRKGCADQAQWSIAWNNPSIHEPQRRKTWLACEAHREWLETFLRRRMFWRSTDPLSSGGDT